MQFLKKSCLSLRRITNERAKQMCTVSINIDEATMRQINPLLTSQESISLWLQHQVDLMIEEMILEDNETKSRETSDPLLHDVTVEELYAIIEQDIKAIYANESL